VRIVKRIACASAAVLVAVGTTPDVAPAAEPPTSTPIQHFVYLMQGGRTFDNYFGTYPGADGLPSGACQARVLGLPRSGCVKPFPLHGKETVPLAPGNTTIEAQYDKGKMDGFVAAYNRQGRDGSQAMGYYDARDLQFYWNVAQQYVLFDAFFSAAPYGVRLNRSYWVSAAPPPGDAERVPAGGYGGSALTIFDRLQAAGVSWKFYVQDYKKNLTARSTADAAAQTARVPLLNYARFRYGSALSSHIVDLSQYYVDLAQGALPAVAYVASSGYAERSARSLADGQRLVRTMLTQLMASQFWSSSAFMWSYDGSGGWYDHVPPPRIGGQTVGLRVPSLLVSPYARRGQVNHTTMDYTSALKFVEDNWRVRPLSRRDAVAQSLVSALDFQAPPRPAAIIQAGAAVPAKPIADTTFVFSLYGSAMAVALLLLLYAALTGLPRRRHRTASHRVATAHSDSMEVRL
jgi:phospholipase C